MFISAYMAQTIFYIIIAVLFTGYLLDRLLDHLNKKYWSNDLPAELKGIYDEEKYSKSQDYEKVNHRFSEITETFTLLLMLLMLYFGGFAYTDTLANSITTHPILVSLIFFGILGLASDIIFTPFTLYDTFVIEEKFGFNKMTVRTFILDKLKGWLIAALLGGGLLALLIWIYQSTGSWFWLIAWGVVSFYSIIMTMFYSNIIVPIFNKQTPLEPGELRSAIEAFAGKTGFKIKNIFVMDGSKRTSKANAYFTGLGPKKRIVLFDTLIKEHTTKELVAILAHEVGHYKKKHNQVSMLVSIIYAGALLYLISIFIGLPVLSQAIGAEKGSFHMGITAFMLLYSPISLVLGVVMNIVSRRNEFQADRYAGTNYDPSYLQDALKKLSVNHLSNLRPHPAYVFFHYSHPPLLERLKELDKLVGRGNRQEQ